MWRLVVLLLVLGAGAAAARAQPAKELYREGQALYDAGQYDEAIATWKEAYVLSDEPLLLFNLGQAYRLKGECAEARVHYENYLKRGTKLHTREAIEKTLSECEEKNREKQEPGDRQQVTGNGGNVSPPPAVAVPESGTGSGAATVAVSGSERDAGKRKKAAAIAVGGTGVVLLLTGVVFGVMASNDLEELEEADGEWNEQLQSLEDRQARNAVLGPVFIGAGVAAVAGGAVLYWMGRREAQAAAVGAAPAAGGGVVTLSGAF